MSDLDKILAKIESRPGAEERISASVARMNKVLKLEKQRKGEARPGPKRPG